MRQFDSQNKYMVAKKVGKKGLIGVLLLATACSVKLDPLTERQVQTIIHEDAKAIGKERIEINKPITIYDAMALAFANNLDYRVPLLEQAVAHEQFDVSKFDMFPRLRASVNATHRNPERASRSESIATRTQSLEPSTSEDRDRLAGDLTFSWNVIDFGVSYYQAKQEANKVLIAKELRRKAFQALLVRVRESYWKAAASQKLKQEVEGIIEKVNIAIANSETVEKQKLRPLLEVLRFRRSLIDILREMKAVKEDLEKAEVDLYMLLNLPIDKEYQLSYQDLSFDNAPVLDLKPEALAQTALIRRPELREEIYRSRISADETMKAMLRLLPGVELRASEYYDSNSYLVDQFWHQLGTHVTSNLMDIIHYEKRMKAVEIQEDLSRQKRMALQIAILSQVHLAAKDYKNAIEKLEQAQKISHIDGEINKLVDISARNEAEMELERIKASASAISTKLQEFQAYANFQNAFGRLLQSTGYDVVNIDMEQSDIDALSQEFRSSFSALEDNRFTGVLMKINDQQVTQKKWDEIITKDEGLVKDEPGVKEWKP